MKKTRNSAFAFGAILSALLASASMPVFAFAAAWEQTSLLPAAGDQLPIIAIGAVVAIAAVAVIVLVIAASKRKTPSSRGKHGSR